MVMVMVFNATFNNISVISWRSVLLVEETEVLGRKSIKWQLYMYIVLIVNCKFKFCYYLLSSIWKKLI